MQEKNSGWWINWLIFIVLSLIWGSSFILMKEGMQVLNAWQVASIRILSAGLVLLPVMVRNIRTLPRRDISLVIVSGLLGTFFPAYLFCFAETRLDSAVAGILNALTPLFTILIGVGFFQLKLSWQKWLGVLTGLAGLVILLSAGRSVDTRNLHFALFIIIATICYGLNVNMVSRYLKHIPSLVLAAFAFSSLIIPSAIILFVSGYGNTAAQDGFLYSTLASAVLGVFGTAVASVLFYMLMKRSGPVFASMVTYGIPFVALFWGFLAGESIGMIQILCLLIILAGVYLANQTGKQRVKSG